MVNNRGVKLAIDSPATASGDVRPLRRAPQQKKEGGWLWEPPAVGFLDPIRRAPCNTTSEASVVGVRLRGAFRLQDVDQVTCLADRKMLASVGIEPLRQERLQRYFA